MVEFTYSKLSCEFGLGEGVLSLERNTSQNVGFSFKQLEQKMSDLGDLICNVYS